MIDLVKAQALVDIANTLAVAAEEVCDSPTNEAFRAARYTWQNMYLGAFVALKVENIAMAKELSDLTRSDEEAVVVIRIMRDRREGDRVYPALAWLRTQRQVKP